MNRTAINFIKNNYIDCVVIAIVAAILYPTGIAGYGGAIAGKKVSLLILAIGIIYLYNKNSKDNKQK